MCGWCVCLRYYLKQNRKSELSNADLSGVKPVKKRLWYKRCNLFLWCALRRTFLTGASPQSALVVGRIQPNIKGVHREVESEGRCRQISGLTNRNHIRL